MSLVRGLLLIGMVMFTSLYVQESKAAAGSVSCNISSSGSFQFDTLAVGSSTSTTDPVEFTCYLQDYTPGMNFYVNMCLSSQDAPPFQMNSNGDSEGKTYTLLFRVYNQDDPTQELQQNSNLMQQTILVNLDNTTVKGTFHLKAVIPAGQSTLPARGYYNYSMVLGIRWNTATSMAALPSCQSGNGEQYATNGGALQSSATISDGCFIQHVTDMDFGTQDMSTLRQGASTTATIQARCPASTHFSIGINKGSHGTGSDRQICNGNGACLNYGLWHDSAASQPWGNTAGVDTLDVSSTDGTVQSYPVYGTIPAQQNITGSGTFSDDVIVTMTY